MRRAAVAAALLLATGGPGTSGLAGSCAPPGIGGAIDVPLDGRIVDFALPRDAGGRRAVMLLVAPLSEEPETGTPQARSDAQPPAPDAPPALPPCPRHDASAAAQDRTLVRVDPAAGAAPTVVLRDLPADYRALRAFDLDGDGSDETLLVRDGALDLVTPDGPRALIEDPAVGWPGVDPAADHGRLPWGVGLGRLVLYGPDGGTWGRRSEIDLPREGRTAGRLLVRTVASDLLGSAADGTSWFATWPEQVDRRRVKVVRIDVSPAGAGTTAECWARLPEAEDVLERSFLVFGDRPHVLLATKPAGKLGLFGEKRLRLYALEHDRTRLGREPWFAVESRVNLWQEIHAFVRDVDGDGREDLVLGYWKGLKDDHVVLDVYRGAEGGGLERAPRTTGFDVDNGDRSFVGYSADLDGDGLADLLLRSDRRLVVHRGLPTRDGRKLVERTAIELPLGLGEPPGETFVELSSGGARAWSSSESNRPRTVDLDGDGAAEVLVVRPGDARTAGSLHVLSAGRR